MGTSLVQALRQPLTHHVQQYVLLLLSLRDTMGEVGGRGQALLAMLVPWGSPGRGTMRPWLRAPALLRKPRLRRTGPGFVDMAVSRGF